MLNALKKQCWDVTLSRYSRGEKVPSPLNVVQMVKHCICTMVEVSSCDDDIAPKLTSALMDILSMAEYLDIDIDKELNIAFKK